MMVLSIFFGKFPRLVYEGKISDYLESEIDNGNRFEKTLFQECIMLVTCLIMALATITTTVIFSREIYYGRTDLVSIVIVILLSLLTVAILWLAKFLFSDIRKVSREVNEGLELLFKVLSIVNNDSRHEQPNYYISEIETRRSIIFWLEKNRALYEMGACRDWEVVLSLTDMFWPQAADNARCYLTSELSLVVTSEWSYKLRIVRVNTRVSVVDLKKILRFKKGLIERPQDSTLFTGKAFSGHEGHDFFEFKNTSTESITLNKLCFRNTGGVIIGGQLEFEREDDSGFLEEGSHVVFFSER